MYFERLLPQASAIRMTLLKKIPQDDIFPDSTQKLALLPYAYRPILAPVIIAEQQDDIRFDSSQKQTLLSFAYRSRIAAVIEGYRRSMKVTGQMYSTSL